LRNNKKETKKIPEIIKPLDHHIQEAPQLKKPSHHVQSPQPNDRRIRVFISSTFRDMQVERDILIKKIFPQLRKLCEERSVTWTEVDLRWGITTEESAEGKVFGLYVLLKSSAAVPISLACSASATDGCRTPFLLTS